ncbi:hypothetical protein [Amycolatopsis australiensis]|uniref:Uncharacterized protein n=1 Tax=Amycolatopsis australiensis TaxID=546364 RepID=A0A1K1RJG7_9PSEU|nr:hypothetical protein [Amycolatopsis australiensis]SFW71947.1 hypothetical protein SAMN04489730_3353 [Amycolatopsis australiensis]
MDPRSSLTTTAPQEPAHTPTHPATARIQPLPQTAAGRLMDPRSSHTTTAGQEPARTLTHPATARMQPPLHAAEVA